MIPFVRRILVLLIHQVVENRPLGLPTSSFLNKSGIMYHRFLAGIISGQVFIILHLPNHISNIPVYTMITRKPLSLLRSKPLALASSILTSGLPSFCPSQKSRYWISHVPSMIFKLESEDFPFDGELERGISC